MEYASVQLIYKDKYDMLNKRVQEYLGDKWPKVKSVIKEALKSDIVLLNQINDYVLENNGKMMRPMISLIIASACGQVNNKTINYAASVELLHNATLLHDDVVDGSMKRRGSPTVNAKLGSSASVLVGDYWLVKAMELILNEEGGEKVGDIFSRTLSNLAEGEMLQMQKAEKGDTTEEDYFRIIYSKTASLFEAACTSAAISVNAPESYIDAAKEYGINLGLAFQIKDDILDYSGSNIGKPIGVDLKEKKITLPLLGALSRVDANTGEEVRKMVCQIEDHPEHIDTITKFVEEYKGVEYTIEVLEDYIERAIKSLSAFPESEAKDILVNLARYTADRVR